MRKSESRTSRDDYIPRSKLEELERKRREWKIEQEKLREHERRKQKMIQEYEERRAREMKLKSRDRRSRSRSHSRHRSRSQSKEREKSAKSGGSSAGASTSAKVPVMSEKCDASSSNTPLFKGGEGSQISVTELKKIKVNIQRNISGNQESSELLREIVNPEEIVVKRREGEGAKPIFEREELKSGENSVANVEERRTVVAVGSSDSHGKKRPNDRRSRSASPARHSRSPQRSSRHESRSRTYSESRHKSYRRDTEDRDRSKYYDRDRHGSHKSSHDYSSHYRPHRSSSPERSYSSRSHRDALPPRDPHDYERGFRGRRAVDDRLSDSRVMPPHYVEPLPIPVYYDNLRPVMVDPMMMMRPPMPMVRGRAPPMMGAFRPPFRPRFIPQEMFRPNAPPNTRFGRTF